MVNLNGLLKVTKSDKKKILSKKEEVKLGKIIQSSTSSDIAKHEAIEILVLRNILLVLKICHKYKRKEFEFKDLVGYGIIGLFTAARKFDPTCKNRFASYARHWIKESIMKAIREYSGLPKIPVYLVKNLWCVSRIVSKDNLISNELLAEYANISISDAMYLRSLLFKVVQFDASYAGVCHETPEDIYTLKERDKLIHDTLKTILTEDEFTVLAHTIELYGYSKMSFIQIEFELNIKNPHKLKIVALKKLRNNSIIQGLHKEGW